MGCKRRRGSDADRLGVLRLTDEDSGGEDEASAYDDLKTGESEAGLEVAVADEGDDDELDPDDRVGPGKGGVNVGDEEGQRVKKAADKGHEAGDKAAEDGITATSKFASSESPSETAMPAVSMTTRVPAAGEAAATVAAAKAIPVAAVVVVRRRHRGDGIVALPRASFKLQEVHPWSCYVEGLVADFLLKVLIGLAPLELYLQFALELAGVVLFLRHDEGGGDSLGSGTSRPADAVDEVVGGVGQVVVDDVGDVLHVDAASGYVGR